MPGVRGKNLRSGDIAEQLGLLLLQSVALVAPIPRTEDVGIDVVATLLRDFNRKKYIAEESFFVQIKSSSVQEIIFKNEQVKWLTSLELPFFIASVDRKLSQMELYCCHRLSNAIISNYNRKVIILELGATNTQDDIIGQDETRVQVGPPILRWSLNTLQTDNSFLQTFYLIVKQHVVFANQAIETRRVGHIPRVGWKTNEIPKDKGFVSMSTLPPRESLENAYDLMMPYFVMWQEQLLRTGDIEAAADIISLLEKTKAIIGSGILKNIKGEGKKK